MIADKRHASNLDCIAKARPGEPMFVVLGRDPTMAAVLDLWASERERLLDAGQLPDSRGEREHVAAVRDMIAGLVDWQAAEQVPSKQRAYELAREAHTAAMGRVGR